MVRNKARKASNALKKDQKAIGKSYQQTNLDSVDTSGTPQTVTQSSEKSSSSSSRHSAWPQKKCLRTDTQEGSLVDAGEDESAGINVTGNNQFESGLQLQNDVDQKSSRSSQKAHKGTPRVVGKKYVLRSLSNGVRVLRSRSNKSSHVPAKTESHSLEVSTDKSKERKRKRKRRKAAAQDELSKTRRRVKYLLLRIAFEQNMIDAYSNEGWKGQSQEKIRPEKELQRAASKILQCKLGIREAFHQLHSLCLEGTLQESAFDSEGQIYSEDIFCAKCGSKDLFPDNDIILCDGACDRGFHQKCLEPPLANEDIPPGDEGWLCPGCDCKIDCFELVNDYLGTNFELEDHWEKVFAEAAAIAVGDEKPLEFGDMPSDDSEDGDYDPDGPELGGSEQQEEEDLSSAESGSTGDAADSSESSSDDEGPESDEGSEVSLEGEAEHFRVSLRDSRKKMSKMGSGKMGLASSQLPINSDTDENDNAALSVSGKRQRQEVDYKKLHDEMFGNDASDKDNLTEDDEWGPRKRSRKGRQLDVEQDDSSIPRVKSIGKVSGKKKKMEVLHVKPQEDIDLSKSTLCKKENVAKDNEESILVKIDKEDEIMPLKGITLSGINSPTKKNVEQKKQLESPSPNRHVFTRLPTLAVERLRKVFGENRLPSRVMKENLAEELGISFKQVNKWFDNARNFARHSAGKKQTDKNDIGISNESSPKTEGAERLDFAKLGHKNQKSSPLTGKQHAANTRQTITNICGSGISEANCMNLTASQS